MNAYYLVYQIFVNFQPPYNICMIWITLGVALTAWTAYGILKMHYLTMQSKLSNAPKHEQTATHSYQQNGVIKGDQQSPVDVM